MFAGVLHDQFMNFEFLESLYILVYSIRANTL